MKQKYGVIKVKGIYPEGMIRETSEESYVVINRNNDPEFYDNLFHYSELLNQDSFYFKPAGEEYGYIIGTNDADYLGYQVKGKRSRFILNVCSNYMSRLRNRSFSFVSDDAVFNKNRVEAMAQIDVEQSQGDYKQHYWKDDIPTSFRKRKTGRNRINESIQNDDILRIQIIEKLHPYAKYLISSYLRDL